MATKTSSAVKSTQKYGRDIYLPENPLKSADLNYLEKILLACDGFNYLNAVHHAGLGGVTGMPSVTEDPINEHLPGGIIIRRHYLVSDILEHYKRKINHLCLT